MTAPRFQLADEVLRRFAASLRSAQLYSKGHPIIARNLSSFSAAIQLLHTLEPTIVIEVGDGQSQALSAGDRDSVRKLALPAAAGLNVECLVVVRTDPEPASGYTNLITVTTQAGTGRKVIAGTVFDGQPRIVQLRDLLIGTTAVLGDGSRWGVDISYVIPTADLGTAGAPTCG